MWYALCVCPNSTSKFFSLRGSVPCVVHNLSVKARSRVARWRPGSPQWGASNPGFMDHSEHCLRESFRDESRSFATQSQANTAPARCGAARQAVEETGRTGTRGAQHSRETGIPRPGSQPESQKGAEPRSSPALMTLTHCAGCWVQIYLSSALHHPQPIWSLR